MKPPKKLHSSPQSVPPVKQIDLLHVAQEPAEIYILTGEVEDSFCESRNEVIQIEAPAKDIGSKVAQGVGLALKDLSVSVLNVKANEVKIVAVFRFHRSRNILETGIKLVYPPRVSVQARSKEFRECVETFSAGLDNRTDIEVIDRSKSEWSQQKLRALECAIEARQSLGDKAIGKAPVIACENWEDSVELPTKVGASRPLIHSKAEEIWYGSFRGFVIDTRESFFKKMDGGAKSALKKICFSEKLHLKDIHRLSDAKFDEVEIRVESTYCGEQFVSASLKEILRINGDLFSEDAAP